MQPCSTQNAFSLVELSIVLVILGLLVGGVLSGQSLIHAAEMRAVSTEFTKYLAATNSFRDKYFALPGDMTNATNFWGTSTTGCAGDPSSLDGTGKTCNGNGDGQITGDASHKEPYWYWQQLALAGLIEGSYIGNGYFASTDTYPNKNVPGSKLSSGVWQVNYGDFTGIGSASYFSVNYGNYFEVSSQSSYNPNFPLLKPEDAWNIDKKFDDGMPGTGKILATYPPFNWPAGATTCNTSANSGDFTGTYSLGSTSLACVLWFVRLF